MKSGDILALLAQRHNRDVFLREVSNGSSSSKTYGRLDAWAMRHSYTRPMTWGYEVKVSRSDFLRDEKWPSYLGVCKSLSFVCPHGLIQPEEVPEGCGLLWVASTGGRLTTKRKAPTRDVTPPADFWMSLLMNQMGPKLGQREIPREERVAEARKALEILKEGKEIGWSTSYLLAHRIRDAERENVRLKRQMESLEECRSILSRLGLGDDMNPHLSLSRAIERETYGHSLDNLKHQLERMTSAIDEAQSSMRGLLQREAAS